MPKTSAPLAKRYLLTGASSGIGRCLGERLHQQGAELITLGRRLPPMYTQQTNWQAWACDLSDVAALSAVLKRLKQHCDSLDAAILCHGYGDFGGIEQFSEARIVKLINTNFTSVALMARSLVPLLCRQPHSDLVLLGSEAARRGGKQGAVYSASKFALRGLAQSLRQECQRRGLRVALVNPGMVDTPFFESLHFAPETRDNALPADRVAAVVEHILTAPPNVVFDEINLSPLKSVVRNKPRATDADARISPTRPPV